MASDPPVDKKSRYDRQLRIWGEAGQSRLESARVCLLHCGPTGCEALKNLVLGGIASFTLVDGAKVTPADLANNYLMTASALGGSRAACAATLLKELNDGVAGSFVEDEPERLLATDPAFFKPFTLVIATQEHTVVESKPDNAPDDLRVSRPWPALAAHCACVGASLGGCDAASHRHVPALVLLVQALAQWKEAHGGAAPKAGAERAAFREGLKARSRSLVPTDDDNIKEALAAAHKAWAPEGVPHDTQTLLGDPRRVAATEAPTGAQRAWLRLALPASTPDFWLLAAALHAFVGAEGGGALPLEGSLPDMASSTSHFVALQRLFAAKAGADVDALGRHAAVLLRAAGRPPGAIPRDAVRLFAKNAAHLAVVRTPPLACEPGGGGEPGSSSRAGALLRALSAEDASRPCAALLLLLRGCDRFHAAVGRFPGTGGGEAEEDAARLRAHAHALLADATAAAGGAAGHPQGAPALPDDLVAELVRAGAAELHCVAAVVGGIAAQEAIKLITHQFVPLSAPLVYNAIEQTTAQVALA